MSGHYGKTIFCRVLPKNLQLACHGMEEVCCYHFCLPSGEFRLPITLLPILLSLNISLSLTLSLSLSLLVPSHQHLNWLSKFFRLTSKIPLPSPSTVSSFLFPQPNSRQELSPFPASPSLALTHPSSLQSGIRLHHSPEKSLNAKHTRDL